MTPTGDPEGTGSGAAPARIPPYLREPAAGERRAPPESRPDRPAQPRPGQLPARPRPFILTAGRVGVDPEIRLETQITARQPLPPWATPVASLAPELQAIVALCAEPTSVAEISARVPLHLGVTRVLVSDLRGTGHLDIHTTDTSNPHDPETILRVIRGLRAIT